VKHITVVFKNAIQVEGSLVSLEDNEMVLQSLDGISSTVIPDIKESILFYKVNSSKEVYEDLAGKTNKTQADLEALVQARGDMNAIDRSSLRERIINSPISNPRKDPYVSRNQSIPSPVQYTEKKVAGANTKFASGLQGMFRKKH
jgi:hypothetical protein